MIFKSFYKTKKILKFIKKRLKSLFSQKLPQTSIFSPHFVLYKYSYMCTKIFSHPAWDLCCKKSNFYELWISQSKLSPYSNMHSEFMLFFSFVFILLFLFGTEKFWSKKISYFSSLGENLLGRVFFVKVLCFGWFFCVSFFEILLLFFQPLY